MGDSGLGWDLMVTVRNLLIGAEEDVPIQCKNYTGEVTTERPIEGLERCIVNSDSETAVLFILGDLSNELRSKLDSRAEGLAQKEGHPVQFGVVDQERIAEMYVSYISTLPGSGMG